MFREKDIVRFNIERELPQNEGIFVVQKAGEVVAVFKYSSETLYDIVDFETGDKIVWIPERAIWDYD